MKKSILFILALVPAALLLSSCQKFEEDTELIHFRTKKKRIEGLKELTMYRLGPTDLMPYWHSRFGDFYLNLTLLSYHPDKKGYGYKVKVHDKASDDLICEGQWGFLTREMIFIYFNCLDSDSSSSFPYNLHEITGTIVRLSNKEMWFSTNHAWHDSLKMSVSKEVRFVEYKKK